MPFSPKCSGIVIPTLHYITLLLRTKWVRMLHDSFFLRQAMKAVLQSMGTDPSRCSRPAAGGSLFGTSTRSSPGYCDRCDHTGGGWGWHTHHDLHNEKSRRN